MRGARRVKITVLELGPHGVGRGHGPLPAVAFFFPLTQLLHPLQQVLAGLALGFEVVGLRRFLAFLVFPSLPLALLRLAPKKYIFVSLITPSMHTRDAGAHDFWFRRAWFMMCWAWSSRACGCPWHCTESSTAAQLHSPKRRAGSLRRIRRASSAGAIAASRMAAAIDRSIRWSKRFGTRSGLSIGPNLNSKVSARKRHLEAAAYSS